MKTELLKLIEEISALQVENANIEDEIKYLTEDKNYFVSEKEKYMVSCFMGLIPISLPIGICAALINGAEFRTDFSERPVQTIFISLYVLATLACGAYFLKERKLYKQNRCDKAIEQLSSQIHELENLRLENIEIIQELNGKLLEFKSCIADLYIQNMSVNNINSCEASPIQKTIGTYE